MLKLSLKRTMELHKEMWEYIKSKDDEVNQLKAEFIFNKGIYETVKNDCFLCEYAANVRRYYFEKTGSITRSLCIFCPVIWGTEDICDDYFCECPTRVSLNWNVGDYDRIINLKVKPELEYLLD